MPRDNRCMYIEHVCFYVCCSDCVGVCGNVCCVAVVVKDSGFLILAYTSTVPSNRAADTTTLVGFWVRDYVGQLPCVWDYVGVKSSFQHACE